MSYDSNNPFAKILSGQLPCIPVCESERVLAFMDIMPQADGHVLVIPKEAAATIFELSEQAAVDCIKMTRRIALAIKRGLGVDNLMIAQVNGAGAGAGQTVPHVHFHVFPKLAGAALREHATVPEDPEKLRRFASLIIGAL